MLIPEQGLWLGADAQLGPPILKIVEAPEPPAVALIAEDPARRLIYQLAVEVEQLQDRVAALEAQTWAARWARFVRWCRHVYDRFMEQ